MENLTPEQLRSMASAAATVFNSLASAFNAFAKALNEADTEALEKLLKDFDDKVEP